MDRNQDSVSTGLHGKQNDVVQLQPSLFVGASGCLEKSNMRPICELIRKCDLGM